MQSLEAINAENTGVVIRGVLVRAKERGLRVSRASVLDELRYRETDNVSQWEAMVDAMMAQPEMMVAA